MGRPKPAEIGSMSALMIIGFDLSRIAFTVVSLIRRGLWWRQDRSTMRA